MTYKQIDPELARLLAPIVHRETGAIVQELRAGLAPVVAEREASESSEELGELVLECERAVGTLVEVLRAAADGTMGPHVDDAFPILSSLALDDRHSLTCGTVYRAHVLLRTAVIKCALPALPQGTGPGALSRARRCLYRAIDRGTGMTSCEIVDTIQRRLTEQKNELALLVRKTMAAHEEERQRVARNVHDVLSQSVTAAWFRVQAARERAANGDGDADLAKAEEALEQCLAEIQRVVRDLRPPVLDKYGLVAAVRDHAARFSREHGLQVNLSDGVYERERLDAEEETGLFRIVQEAMTNAARHGRAKTVTVRINATAEEVRVDVSDDGVGFDAQAFMDGTPGPHHFGLLGMRERAQLLGGELDVQSARGAGTTVRVRVPRRPSRAKAPSSAA